jgi:hypothetical protein
MALLRAAGTLFFVALTLASTHRTASGQSRQASPYSVSNVRAEAEASNAVDAKKAAIQFAETRAFHLLVTRLADFRSQQRVPDLPAADIERLVSNIDVRNEGVSATSYVATFEVRFSERAVNTLFGQYNVIPILDRGPEILIVPVYVEDGAAKTTDRNPWSSALRNLDLAHALVPAKVAPVRGDITAAIADAYAANPGPSVETLKSQYHSAQVLLAVAELEGNGDTIGLKLIGSDGIGLFSTQRKVKNRDGVDEPLMDYAARVAFDTVQERWKLTRDTFAAGAPASGDGGATPAYAPSSGAPIPLLVTAQYSGLREWQTIRSKLQGMPGVQNWDLKSVNPRSAQIGFDFPGGAERLTILASSQGLSVESGPEGLIVKTR